MKCKYCGKEFNMNNSSQKFCSSKCRYAYWNKRRCNSHKGSFHNTAKMSGLEYLLIRKESLEDLMSDDNF